VAVRGTGQGGQGRRRNHCPARRQPGHRGSGLRRTGIVHALAL